MSRFALWNAIKLEKKVIEISKVHVHHDPSGVIKWQISCEFYDTA